MAKLVDEKQKVEMGVVVWVENLNKKASAKDRYAAVKVEDENGKNERWLLFTKRELYSQRTYNIKGLSALMKRGRLYEGEWLMRDRYAVTLKLYSKENEIKTDCFFLLPHPVIAKAEERAHANPEDIPKQDAVS